jgi:hypothetical protein
MEQEEQEDQEDQEEQGEGNCMKRAGRGALRCALLSASRGHRVRNKNKCVKKRIAKAEELRSAGADR